MRGILFYMAIYALMTIGAFGCILCMRRQGRAVEGIADLSGLARSQPGLALAMAIFMFSSWARLLPLAGFLSKFYIFLAAIDARLYGLAVIGVLTSVVGAYYYVRIVKVMYFDEPAPAFDRPVSPCGGRRGARGLVRSCPDPSVLRLPGAAGRQRRRRGGNALHGMMPLPASPSLRLLRYDRLGSTNDDGQTPPGGHRGPTAEWTVVIWAGEQTAGRGRGGSSFALAVRNSYFSAILRHLRALRRLRGAAWASRPRWRWAGTIAARLPPRRGTSVALQVAERRAGGRRQSLRHPLGVRGGAGRHAGLARSRHRRERRQPSRGDRVACDSAGRARSTGAVDSSRTSCEASSRRSRPSGNDALAQRGVRAGARGLAGSRP